MAPKMTWAGILQLLDHYSCECGSGGAIACDDDCPGPGQWQDPEAREAIRALIRWVLELEFERAAEKADIGGHDTTGRAH